MDLDWNALSLSGYIEALVAHNSEAGGDEGPSDMTALQRFMAARKETGNA